METTEREMLARLIRGGRWSALATYGDKESGQLFDCDTFARTEH